LDLQEIERLFFAAQKTSERYELVSDEKDLVRLNISDMKPVPRGLHNRLRDLAHRRQKSTSIVRKAAWALYDKNNLEGLVEKIAISIEDLEKLFPAETVCRKLVEIEIEEVDDEPSLTVLKDAATGIDKMLFDAANQKMGMIAGKNYVGDLKAEDTAKVLVGDEVSEAVLAHGISITEQTTNSVKTVTAVGQSKVQVGNRLGTTGFLD
jgi:hypothetical protein